MRRSKPKVEFLLQRSFHFIHHVTLPTFPCVSLKLQLNSAVYWLIPAKALEILSFFHSQGWSYSSGGRSSSCGSLLSLGQRERSGSESPPFSAGSYGVSYRGSCLTDPSFGPLPVPPDRISKKEQERLVIGAWYPTICGFEHSSLTKCEFLHTNIQSYKKGALLFCPFFLHILHSSAVYSYEVVSSLPPSSWAT